MVLCLSQIIHTMMVIQLHGWTIHANMTRPKQLTAADAARSTNILQNLTLNELRGLQSRFFVTKPLLDAQQMQQQILRTAADNLGNVVSLDAGIATNTMTLLLGCYACDSGSHVR